MRSLYRPNLRHPAAAALTLLVLTGAMTARAQTVANGTFDINVPQGRHGITVSGGGWTSFSVDAAGGMRATGGNLGPYYVLNDNGDPTTDPTLSQSISGFTIGNTYTVSGFYKLDTAGGSNTVDSFGAAINGTVLFGAPTPVTAQGTFDFATWRPFSFSFTAGATSNTLSLLAERNGTDTSYGVDTITISQQAVSGPEPGALALLVTGSLLPIAARFGRRHRAAV